MMLNPEKGEVETTLDAGNVPVSKVLAAVSSELAVIKSSFLLMEDFMLLALERENSACFAVQKIDTILQSLENLESVLDIVIEEVSGLDCNIKNDVLISVLTLRAILENIFEKKCVDDSSKSIEIF